MSLVWLCLLCVLATTNAPKAKDIELREAVVVQSVHYNIPTDQIATLNGICSRTVERYVERYITSGTLSNTKTKS